MPLDPILKRLVNLAYRTEFDKLHLFSVDRVRRLLIPQNTRLDIPYESYQMNTHAGCRVYRPRDFVPHQGAVLYIRGSAFVGGSLDIFNEYCDTLANRLGLSIISLDHRLAPEDPFPLGLNDCVALVQWIYQQAPDWSIDPENLALWGESSGGNLAASCAQMVRDINPRILKHQTLVYPMVDAYTQYPSKKIFQKGVLLDKTFIDWLTRQYSAIQDEKLREDVRISPGLNPNLKALPPTTIVTAEYDPIRDEAETYAKNLQHQGVNVHHIRAKGMTHGFLMYYKKLEKAAQILDTLCHDVKQHIAIENQMNT